ncbi:MAG: helix-turn-helix domain-containing protein [Roseiarcus sp.]
MERCRVKERAARGRADAKAKGVKFGRKPKLTPHQIKEARQRLAEGEKTRDLAKIYAVNISTISRLT